MPAFFFCLSAAATQTQNDYFLPWETLRAILTAWERVRAGIISGRTRRELRETGKSTIQNF